ncbi:chromosome partitioning protein MukE [Photobacterium aquimaris]|uniref:Chromosome partition protein MukE n=2 Tax=Photobacterium TaxID=657 RepID=A0A2T3IT17_9GAMM|nr:MULTISPECIES: chromosome partition protein MukE [Photobacterium]OBU18483.1 chromosome partitioning protein MukE [Photobacterium aquimaris]OBU20904.1 chromosome partitioning protein MukE [Photobacterium aquimaris]PSU31496.1 chromosome partition protein MukE [Photobacterium aquimaris]PSW03180.1 chromosome partition protein MukE [Photobacterium aquimaris]SMY32515.1 Chromosome partition protein MukE [Photobacterium malacitanum]
MSLTNIEEFMPEKLAKAIANPLFPALDNALRSGRHVSSEDLDNHAYLIEFEKELAMFYRRYNAELVRAPEGFLYLRPRSTSLIGRSVLSEIDMLVGKVLCFLYLSPERLAHEGIFTNQELFDELLVLADEQKLMKLVTNRASGSDLDREKLFDKVKTSLRRLRRLGMLIPIGENGKFRISESVFRFGADVRTGDDVREAQLRLIRDGEAVVHQQPSSQSSLLDDVDTNNQEELEMQQDVEQAVQESSI